jgi:geranylgeranyl pyrophosphate synthase
MAMLQLDQDPLAAVCGQRLILVADYLLSALPTSSSSRWSQALTTLLQQPRGLLAASVRQSGRVSEDDKDTWALHALLAFGMAAQANNVSSDPATFATAIPIAAAWDVIGVTLDLIDDLQDNDQPVAALSQALSVAVGGMGMAVICLSDAHLAPSLAKELERQMGTALLTAAEGQFWDGEFEREPAVSLNESLHMTALKSGSLVRGLYYTSALAGAATRMSLAKARALANAVGAFGQELGTYWQLSNDTRDADPDTQKSDRRRHKKTLPLVMEDQIGPAPEAQRQKAGHMVGNLACLLAQQRACAALEQLHQRYFLDTSWLEWMVSSDEESA